MALRITCPECKTVCKIDDNRRGKKVRCQECDCLLPLPAREAAIVDMELVEGFQEPKGKSAPLPGPKRGKRDDDDDRPDPRSRRDGGSPGSAKKKGGGGLLAVLLIGCGGLSVLGVVGVLAVIVSVFAFRSGPPDERAPVMAQNQQAPLAMPPPPPNGFNPGQVDQDPAPVIKGPGPDIKIPPPADLGPAPDKIADTTLKTVKQSTVYLRVTMTNGLRAEGSGFFAAEPGVIITNAHVLGMLGSKSMPPANVDVVVHSGEPNQTILKGVVAGVDRGTDLAVVRVPTNGLPPPLPLASTSMVADLQKVYILGFPFGKQAATNVTVSEAAISGLGKDNKTGAIDQVRLTGDMQPGNSGGPVVDAAGRVIGVSVAIMRGTRINFAVPADFIKTILDGRLAESRFGEPFANNNQTMLPVKFQCLDPLSRVQDFRVEIWTGSQGPERSFANAQPAAMPGDGPRQAIPIGYKDGKAIGDIPLPPLPPGQVYWIQPVVVNGAGVTQWQPASMLTAKVPLQRVPADLLMKLDPQGQQRTVRLRDEARLTIYQGKEKYTEGQEFEASFLEVVTPSPKGPLIQITIGENKFTEEKDGALQSVEPTYFSRLSKLSPSFLVNAAGRFVERNTPKLKDTLPQKDKDILDMLMTQFCNANEEVLLYMPNRRVQPMESWRASVPTIVGKRPKLKVLDIELTCTYEGSRSTNGRNEAFISLVGAIKSREKNNKDPLGHVAGRALLDLDAGFLSQVNMRLTTEMDLGGAQLVISEDVSLTRVAGNTKNIVAFAPPKKDPPIPDLKPKTDPPITKKDPPTPDLKPKTDPPPVLAGPKVILDAEGRVAATDLLGPKARKCKNHEVKLEAGQLYVIEMKKVGTSTFNPFLLLLDANGKVLAQDDDSGDNKNAKITFRAKESGTYKVVATSSIGIQIGMYHLTVTAVPPEKKE